MEIGGLKYIILGKSFPFLHQFFLQKDSIFEPKKAGIKMTCQSAIVSNRIEIFLRSLKGNLSWLSKLFEYLFLEDIVKLDYNKQAGTDQICSL